MPGSRSSQRPCVSLMSSGAGAKTSKTKPAARLEQPVHRAQRRAAVGVGLHVQQRAERRSIDERERALDRRVAQVAEAQVDLDARGRRRARARPSSIPADESTPITSIPAAAIGTAMRPVPTPSSTTGPPERRASST